MGIPILNDINKDLTRLCVAGSSLGKNDPRIKKYIPVLNKMGEKIAIFKALALKLETIISGENTSGGLIDSLTILYSILNTQGSTDTEDYKDELEFSNRETKISKLPYSKLRNLKEVLQNNTLGKEDILIDIYEQNIHNDFRLYDLYCDSIYDRKSRISIYLEETLIPSIGEDIVPFIEERLDIKGGKKDARLFKILYKIKGKEIVPLSMEIIESGSKDLIVEAIYTLGEDKKYEEMLLEYVEKGTAIIKEAAFYSLIKIGSIKGEEQIFDLLEKPYTKHLCKALEIIKNPEIVGKIIAEIKKEILSGIEHKERVLFLLKVLAKRNNLEGLNYVEEVFTDLDLYEKLNNKVDMEELISYIQKQEGKEKQEMLYRIYNNNNDLASYALKSDINSEMNKEEVYEKYNKIIKEADDNNLRYILFNEYKVYENKIYIDCHKPWDRKWGSLFLDMNDIPAASAFVYDDDVITWSKLLEKQLNSIKKPQSHNDRLFAGLLAKAYNVNHPEVKKYFDLFSEKAHKKEYFINCLDKLGVNIEELK